MTLKGYLDPLVCWKGLEKSVSSSKNGLLFNTIKAISKGFLAIRQTVTLNEMFILFC